MTDEKPRRRTAPIESAGVTWIANAPEKVLPKKGK